MMLKNLEKLAFSHNFCDLDLLQRAFLEWPECTQDERDDFISLRKSIAQKMAGVYFDQGTKLQTSGSTCGVRKKYLWGPFFEDHHKFFEWLKFRWFDYKSKYYLKLKWGEEEKLRIDDLNVFKAINMPIKTEGKELADKIGNEKIVLEIIPTYTKYLMNIGFDFSVFNPESILIYSTGEKSTPEMIDYYRKFGLFYLDGMRCWTGGATFITCEYGNKHWIDMVSKSFFNNNDELISTDLFNLAQPFLSYPTGDIIESKRGIICSCGLPIDEINYIEKSVSLESIGISKISFQTLVNTVERSIFDFSGSMNPLLICTFGLHEASDSLVVFFETANPIKDFEKAAKKFKDKVGLSKDVYFVEQRIISRYKAEKIVFLSDQDFEQIKRATPSVAARKIHQ